MSSHRTRSPRTRLALALGALLAVAALTVGGTALAAKATTSNPGTTVANTVAVAANNTGERGTFRVTDTGNSLVVHGDARGLQPEATYVSLFYPSDNCTGAETPSSLTLAGAFVNPGQTRRTLDVAFTGKAYRDVRGKIGSESIRRVTTIASGASTFTATLTPVACADLVPNR